MAHEDECKAANVDPKEVDRIARGLSRYAKEANKLGFYIFGGSETGTLRFDDGSGKGELILDYLEGRFDGGAGDSSNNEDGLLRGETF